jgi:formylglycine-generating enzyme required for sulfatase activity
MPKEAPRPRPVLRPGAPLPAQATNSLGMKFMLVPAGQFLMGSPETEEGRQDDEWQHAVMLTRPFYLGIYPVTQEQYQRLMQTNPSHFSPWGRGKALVKGQDTRLFPVERVTWGNALAFCRRLSEAPEEQRAGRTYRLPTEAEWEHACRFGGPVGQAFHFGDALSSAQANFDGRKPHGGAARGPNLKRTTAVGSYPPSSLGLFDLHGNVWEWCQDWYYEDWYYEDSPAEDPQGPEAGAMRVVRGGCWSSPGSNCRTAFRGKLEPGTHLFRTGFRVVLDVG